MKFTQVPLMGAYIIDPVPLRDERGLFTRIFCTREFSDVGLNKPIVQINQSETARSGTVRGMHYQQPPAAETKIIRCIRGAIFDVMVDLRTGSPTFKQWLGVELSSDNGRMVFIPEGFCHGFQALTDNVAMIYHHSAFHSPQHERGVRFDDPAIGIVWPLPIGMVSAKDCSYPLISETFKGVEI